MNKNFKISKGEQKIIKILLKEDILFNREKTFLDLKKNKFRFDFYLPKYNICIEYDGIQHFEYTSYFQKSRQDFLKQQEHDRIKNSYCLSHKITLYRIPYWKLDNLNNINDIFTKEFEVKSKWHNDIIIKRRNSQI